MSRYVRYSLAGLQTGITGAIAMLVWFAIASTGSNRSIWWVPNLVASAVYGEGSLTNKPGLHTIVGVAMLLFGYGLVGLAFGVSIKEQPGSWRLLFSGVVVGLGVHFLMLRFFWKAANPVAYMYAPDTQILVAHLLFGCFLARFPRTLRYINR